MPRDLTAGQEIALRGVDERDIDAAPESQEAFAALVAAREAQARGADEHAQKFAGLLDRVDETMRTAEAARVAVRGELAHIRAQVLLGEADEESESAAIEEMMRLERVVERCKDGRRLIEGRIDASYRALAPLKRESVDADDRYTAVRETVRRRLAGI